MRTLNGMLFALVIAGLLSPLQGFAAVSTTTTLALAPAGPVPFEQTVTMTATVTDASNSAVLHGSVTFYDGTVKLGTAQMISNGSGGFTPGTAIYRTRSLAQGSHSLTARFDGTAADLTSMSGAQALTIGAAAGPYPSATALTASATSNTTLDATAVVGGFGPLMPTGNVTLNDLTSSTTVGTQPVGTASAGFVEWTTPLSFVTSTCSQPTAASGDFNNDGNLDVVVAGWSDTCSAGHSVLGTILGNGQGGFTAATTVSPLGTTIAPSQLAVADFNGDGNLDVAVIAGNSVLLLLGNGDGTFQAPTTLFTSTSVPLYSILTAQFTGSGNADIALLFFDGENVYASIMAGAGDGTFGQPGGGGGFALYGEGEPVPESVTPPVIPVFAAGDLYNNGHTDIVITMANLLGILVGDGTGNFTVQEMNNENATSGCGEGGCATETMQSARSIALADLTGSGYLDILIGSVGNLAYGGTYSSQIQAFLGNGSVTNGYQEVDVIPLPNVTVGSATYSPSPNMLATGDFTYTGYTGVAALTDQGTFFLPGSATGFLQGATSVGGPLVEQTQVATGDFANNGNFDFAVPVSGTGATELGLFQPASVATAALTNAPVADGGVQQFDAVYAGDSNFSTSTSNTVSVSFTLPPTIAITSNLPKSLEALTGADVELTTTVTGPANAVPPTGSVQLYDGSTPIGALVPLSNGSATYTSTAFSLGSHSVTAKYEGDATYAGQTSPAVAFTVVAQGQTTVNVSIPSSANPILRVTSAGLTLYVTESTTILGPGPSGTVTVTDNGSPVLTTTFPYGGSLSVNLDSPPFTLGSNTMVATFEGSSTWAGSSTTYKFMVGVGTMSFAGFTCGSQASLPAGSEIRCSASLKPQRIPNAPTPTGTVSLLQNGTVVATEPVTNSGFTANFTVGAPPNLLDAGTYTYSMSYSGDVTWESATSGTQTITMTDDVPGFTLTSNLGAYPSAVQGTTVTATATVTAAGGLPAPTGTVQFSIDGTVAGSPVPLSNGMASYSTSSLSSGSHTITAAYSGDSFYSGTTTNGTVVVVPQGPDALAIAIGGPSTVSLGTPATVNGTLTVGALGPAPTGTVTLLDGTTALATTTLSGNAPIALAFNVNTAASPLAPGSHTFSLKYAGTAQWLASASSTAAVTVTQAATATTVTSSAATADAGTSVTLTATIAPTVTSPAPTGTVQFYDGTTVLGSAVTLANGSATYTTTTLAGGTHSITAVYSGDANFATSTSAAFTETIQGIGLTVGTPSGPVNPGGMETYTLTVAADGGLNESTSFACTAGLPRGAACSFSPQTVTGSGSTTLTITTTGTTAMAVPAELKLWGARGGAVFAGALLLWLPKRRRKQWLMAVMLLLVPALMLGCGGGSTGGGGGGGTPAGSYTVTVTSTTGSGTSAITGSTTVTLTVQ